MRNLSLLRINNLRTYYSTLTGDLKAVDGISFEISKGEALGLAGESGCGKSSVALSIMRVLPSNCRIVSGEVFLDEKDILNLDHKAFRSEYQWKRISMIFQGAQNSLNPVLKIGDQISECIKNSELESKTEALERSKELLKSVAIDPKRVSSHPHELSGGQRQRVMIAMALACNPDVLIADEPTTALDVIVQANLIHLIERLQNELNLCVLLISHDLSIIAEMCDKVAVMYASKFVEYGNIFDIFRKPAHPYTQKLIRAFPSIKGKKIYREGLSGSPPNLINPPVGCLFHPRCPYARNVCKKEEPSMVRVGRNHHAACHLL